MTRRAQGLLATLAVLVAVAVAAVVVATASSAQRPMQQRVNEVAQGLKCPTCEAESVAASNTPIAQSMRRQIRSQLSHGRSPAQVRSWFEARYGAQVLLTPPTSGTGLLLWAVPVVALVAGGAIWVTADRRRRARTATAAGRPSPAAPLSPARVGVAAVALLVVGAAVPVAVWARSGRNDAQPVAATTGQQPAAAKAGGSKDWTAVAQTLEDQHDYAGGCEGLPPRARGAPRLGGLDHAAGLDLLAPGDRARQHGPPSRWRTVPVSSVRSACWCSGWRSASSTIRPRPGRCARSSTWPRTTPRRARCATPRRRRG